MNKSSNPTIGSVDWLVSTVKKNPEGLLLLAAGCALMLRTQSSSDERSRQTSTQYPERREGSASHWQMPEGVSRTADQAREYASDVGKKVSEAAKDYVSAAGEYADEARQTIVNQSERLADRAQGTVERIVRDQPLAVAIAGLAAGAAIASAFPPSDVERKTLGAAGKRLTDVANSAGERITKAASAAGERLADVAKEKGLDADGLKAVAKDVAGTIGKTMSGPQGSTRSAEKDPSWSSSKANQASGSTIRGGPSDLSRQTAAQPTTPIRSGSQSESNAPFSQTKK